MSDLSHASSSVLASGEALFFSKEEELRKRPDFIEEIDPKQTKLASLIGKYRFPRLVRCGLSDCHRPNKWGYVGKTVEGYEVMIGHVCGDGRFADFQKMRRD